MGARTIKGSTELGNKIRLRRHELGLTIEEAASKAGVGTKTWSRYETGESIRTDKILNVCKALGWHVLPTQEKSVDIEFNLNTYKNRDIWPHALADAFGVAAAISFVIGSDILLDNITQDLNALSRRPKGTHIGELELSWLEGILPLQFLTQYDYNFLYYLKTIVINYRRKAVNKIPFVAHTVAEELTLYLIMNESKFLMEGIMLNLPLEHCKTENDHDCFHSNWEEWPFNLFDDMDIITFLYSDCYLEKSHAYHFKHWREAQFYSED